MPDKIHACPYCHESTLPASIGITGRARALALVQKAEEALRDDDVVLRALTADLAEKLRTACTGE